MGANKLAGGAGQAMGQGVASMYGGGPKKPMNQSMMNPAQGQGLGPSPDMGGKMAMLMQKRQQMQQGNPGAVGQGAALGQGNRFGQMAQQMSALGPGMGQPGLKLPKMGGVSGGLGAILARRQQQQNPMASPEQQPINPYMQSPEPQPQMMNDTPDMGMMEPPPQMSEAFGNQAMGQMAPPENRPMAPRMGRGFGRSRQY